jgi:uncharacterized membrane protein
LLYLIKISIKNLWIIACFISLFILCIFLYAFFSIYPNNLSSGFLHAIKTSFLISIVPFLFVFIFVFAAIDRRNKKEKAIKNNQAEELSKLNLKEKAYSISSKLFVQITVISLIICFFVFLLPSGGDMAGLGFVIFVVLSIIVAAIASTVTYYFLLSVYKNNQQDKVNQLIIEKAPRNSIKIFIFTNIIALIFYSINYFFSKNAYLFYTIIQPLLITVIIAAIESFITYLYLVKKFKIQI